MKNINKKYVALCSFMLLCALLLCTISGCTDNDSVFDLEPLSEEAINMHSYVLGIQGYDPDDILYCRYYGTYNDGFVLFYSVAKPESVEFTLAGEKFTHNWACGFMYYKTDGSPLWASLSDAYNVYKWLSDEDIHKIAKYHREYERRYANELKQDREESVFYENNLTETQLTELSDAYGYKISFDGSGIRYYGTYNDGILIFTVGETDASIDFTVADERFYYHSGCSYRYYKNGELYNMVDAYNQGLLSDNDIHTIAKYHNELWRYYSMRY